MESGCWIDTESHMGDESDQVTDVVNDEIESDSSIKQNKLKIYIVLKISHTASKKWCLYVGIIFI